MTRGDPKAPLRRIAAVRRRLEKGVRRTRASRRLDRAPMRPQPGFRELLWGTILPLLLPKLLEVLWQYLESLKLSIVIGRRTSCVEQEYRQPGMHPQFE